MLVLAGSGRDLALTPRLCSGNRRLLPPPERRSGLAVLVQAESPSPSPAAAPSCHRNHTHGRLVHN